MDIPEACPHHKVEVAVGDPQHDGYSIRVETDYAGDEESVEHDQLWVALCQAIGVTERVISASRPKNRTHAGGSASTGWSEQMLGHTVTATITLNDGRTVNVVRGLVRNLFDSAKSELALALTI